MSAHIEWLDAAGTSVQTFAPGEEWVGQGLHRRPVLTLAQDDIVAIEGTPPQIRALAARITAATRSRTPADEHEPATGNTSVSIAIERPDGSHAFWSVTEAQADAVSEWIETHAHRTDFIRC